jgi:hypothetical protein
VQASTQRAVSELQAALKLAQAEARQLSDFLTQSRRNEALLQAHIDATQNAGSTSSEVVQQITEVNISSKCSLIYYAPMAAEDRFLPAIQRGD